MNFLTNFQNYIKTVYHKVKKNIKTFVPYVVKHYFIAISFISIFFFDLFSTDDYNRAKIQKNKSENRMPKK